MGQFYSLLNMALKYNDIFNKRLLGLVLIIKNSDIAETKLYRIFTKHGSNKKTRSEHGECKSAGHIRLTCKINHGAEPYCEHYLMSSVFLIRS